MKKVYILLAMLLISAASLGAQNKVAIKTNLVHDATLSPNLALEFGLAPKWTLDLSAAVNLWDSYGHTYKHIIGQPELRFWTCEKFNGFFIGLHGIGGKVLDAGNLYNYKWINKKCPNLRESSIKDAMVLGAGLSCGYDVILARHWNLEFELGAGYVYASGKEVKADKTGKTIIDYVGPTKLAINLVYLF